MGKETNRLLGHGDEADGIDEYDNPLPDWWLGLLWFTIFWAIGYSVHYHFIADRSAVKELAAEMAAAEVRWPQQATDVEFALSPEAIAAGESLYQVNCTACHGMALEGGIGPNLVDDEWIHGGSVDSVLNTIRNGVLEKGMLNWEPILGPEGVNHVGAYILAKNAEALGRSLDDLEPGG